MKNFFFYLGIALLCTHEMDAMPNHEWRVLPIMRALEDAVGEIVFVLAHIPLFAVLIGLVASLNSRVRRTSRFWVAVFMIVHSGLHFAFSGHHAYEFDSMLSSGLIYGAAICGVAYFVASHLEGKRVAA